MKRRRGGEEGGEWQGRMTESGRRSAEWRTLPRHTRRTPPPPPTLCRRPLIPPRGTRHEHDGAQPTREGLVGGGRRESRREGRRRHGHGPTPPRTDSAPQRCSLPPGARLTHESRRLPSISPPHAPVPHTADAAAAAAAATTTGTVAAAWVGAAAVAASLSRVVPVTLQWDAPPPPRRLAPPPVLRQTEAAAGCHVGPHAVAPPRSPPPPPRPPPKRKHSGSSLSPTTYRPARRARHRTLRGDKGDGWGGGGREGPGR